nr:MAG TPA: hypothetical protein [Caudoviricetes sp.]DAY20243.1 MAG TPA: hypothetical protein [Caudoviricetes sp.]
MLLPQPELGLHLMFLLCLNLDLLFFVSMMEICLNFRLQFIHIQYLNLAIVQIEQLC